MRINNIIFALIITFAVTSCSNRLDITPQNGISPEQINKDNIDLFLNGLYRSATTSRDVYVLPDMRGGNYTWTALSGNNSSYARMATGNDVDDRLVFSKTIWTNNYKTIFNANNIIEAAEKLKNDATISKITAEATFFRAWAYYQLVVNFGDVPIFLSIKTDNKARDSKKLVYEQIFKDLDNTIVNAGDFSSMTRVSKQLAKAFKARVLLQIGKKNDAALLAKSIIDGGFLSLDENYAGIFRNTAKSKEVLFAFSNLESETNVRMSQLFWPYGTAYAGSYFVQPTDEVINNLYSQDDIRKDVNIKKITNDDGTFNYIISKYHNVQPLIISRISEMYLICAEGLPYKEGIKYINELRQKRGLAKLSIEEFNSEKKMLDQVMLERRKELFSEGFLYLDYVRTGRAVELSNTKNENQTLLPIPGDQINLSKGILKQNEY